MRKFVVLCLLCVLLSGCSGSPSEMETAMDLRTKLLQASGCSFDTKITADYGDKLHTFSMTCQADSKGKVAFTVTEPETISGITGNLSAKGGEISFADTALHFPLLAEDQISPVSAPWILMQTLRAGFLTSACREEGGVRLSVDDSYEEEPLRLDIWLNSRDMPTHADILYDGRRILSLDVENFAIL